MHEFSSFWISINLFLITFLSPSSKGTWATEKISIRVRINRRNI